MTGPAASSRERRQYVWSYWMGDIVHGGMKARLDVEAFLRDSGKWDVFDTGRMKSKPARLLRIVRSLVWLLRQPRRTVFLLQYPIHGGRAQRAIGALLLRRFRVAVMLHDLDELRDGTGTPPTSLLERASFIISTGRLHERLDNTLKDIPLSVLELWDYRVVADFSPGPCDPASPVLFAGSLWPVKVSWLYRRDANRPGLCISGHGYDLANNPGCGDTLRPSFPPDNPVFNPAVGWGLIWDGHKIDGADAADDYERINQPHKLSLYLTCGLPVIVWDKSYAARWVTANGCGIVTPSLADIPGILAKITPAEHEGMRRRSLACGAKVSHGYYLLAALERLGL